MTKTARKPKPLPHREAAEQARAKLVADAVTELLDQVVPACSARGLMHHRQDCCDNDFAARAAEALRQRGLTAFVSRSTLFVYW